MFSLLRRPGIHYLLWRVGLARAQTQTSVAERDCLCRHAKNRKRLVEIGVWHGVTTRRLRSAMTEDGVLFAIDPFPRGRFGFSWERLIALGEIARETNGTVELIELTSTEAAGRFGELCRDPLDFVFIDGEHSFEAVQADWNAWTSLLAPGGIAALHDSRCHPGLTSEKGGVATFTRTNVLADPNFTMVEFVDSLTVFVRNDDTSRKNRSIDDAGASADDAATPSAADRRQSALIDQYQDPQVSEGSSIDLPAFRIEECSDAMGL